MKLPKLNDQSFGAPNWLWGIVAGAVGYAWWTTQDLINPDILGLGENAMNINAVGGQGQASPGGKTNTPGWYTLQGHHHCGVDANGSFSAGCLCTDPKKCFGHSGTGSQYCAAHPEECAPVDKPNWCAYWYASDQKYCNLCAGKWKYTGPNGSGAKACP